LGSSALLADEPSTKSADDSKFVYKLFIKLAFTVKFLIVLLDKNSIFCYLDFIKLYLVAFSEHL